ncbi:MAG TPA: hypothetical protein VNT56_09830, partial [Acidimicrobiales bacterium]|nr:hypothetical protein [Acidimicrobiales bacterium]
QVVLVAAGEDGVGDEPPGDALDAPWPGRLPSPAPSLVHDPAPPVEVVAAGGEAVAVTSRGLLSAGPARVSLAGGPWQRVLVWAGPWPVDERWWDPVTCRRRARIQAVLDGGEAHLLVLAGGHWTVEATYD